ncbi:hypothetical protein BDV96DRAFT_15135 [Lophiotrema nucula]|uniref:Uncharacterized protein n=1 Tax=Lophiotrema nucula TaxID=690887 RepID=A0A6A5ZU40_9PLEO|nr:hypothetical protein BDV96DRAFT_15135 [Lophiotrema nucula]
MLLMSSSTLDLLIRSPNGHEPSVCSRAMPSIRDEQLQGLHWRYYDPPQRPPGGPRYLLFTISDDLYKHHEGLTSTPLHQFPVQLTDAVEEAPQRYDDFCTSKSVSRQNDPIRERVLVGVYDQKGPAGVDPVPIYHDVPVVSIGIFVAIDGTALCF